MLKFLKAHKILSALVILGIGGIGYWQYTSYVTSHLPMRYVLTAATKGTIVTSVSGSGQISSSNQFELKPKASGDVLKLNVTEGQVVKAGDVIAQLDARDALKTVRDANAGVQSAKISLEKLKAAATPTQIAQAENSLASAQTSLQKLQLSQPIDYQNALDTKQKAYDAISKTYADAFNNITNTFLDLPNALTTIHNAISGTDIDVATGDQENADTLHNSIRSQDQADREKFSVMIQRSSDSYLSAKRAYDTAFSEYKNASRSSDATVIDSLLSATLDTTQKASDGLKNTGNAYAFWVDYRTLNNLNIISQVKTHQSALATDTANISGALSTLLSLRQTITDNEDTLRRATQAIDTMTKNNPLDLNAAQANVVDRQNALNDLKAGANTLDVQSAQLSLQQKQNALVDAQEKLADYTVRAPFDGTVANIVVKKGDPASSSAAIATLITQQQIATISLNEVDVSKIAVGQKVTLSFDAISGLQLTGSVATIDSIGTVAQGVVTYTVKIGFDTQDDRIKSGMSVSAAIMTNVKTDVLTVPNAAVKTSSNGSYVQMLETIPSGVDVTALTGIPSATAPKQVPVVVGLSNDSVTEIVSGINDGDQVVIRTIDPKVKTTASQGTSLFQATGATGNRGGAAGAGTRTTGGTTRPGG